MKRPRILLGTPTHDGKAYCLEHWARTIHAIRKFTRCDVLIVDNSTSPGYARMLRQNGLAVVRSPAHPEPLRALGEARRKLYDHAIAGGYDFLFSLEQDLFPPPDIIEHLLALRRRIAAPETVVAAPYIMRYVTRQRPPYHSIDRLTSAAAGLMYSRRAKRQVQRLLTLTELRGQPAPMPVFSAGLGCALIDVPLLRRIEVRYSQERFQPDDACFFLDLKALEIPVYIDPGLAENVIHITGNVRTIDAWWTPLAKPPAKVLAH
jgi:GT2 family glycosyltransferase